MLYLDGSQYEMTNKADSDRYHVLLRWVPLTASASVVAVGSLVMVGWWLDVAILKGSLAGFPPVRPTSALAFMLAGISLWLLRAPPPEGWRRRAALVCASIVVLIGVLSLGDYLFGWNVDTNHLLVKDLHPPVEPHHALHRTAFAAALNCLLFGGALLLLDVKAYRGHGPAMHLAGTVGACAFLTLVAYLYGGAAIHQAYPFATVAPLTALLFLILSIGLVFARSRHPVVGIVTGQTSAAAAMRRLLVVAILLPVSAGWIRLMGERSGLYGMEFGLSLMVLFAVIGLTVSICWQATTLIQAEEYQRGINEVGALLGRSIILDDTFPACAAVIKTIVACDRICVVVREGEKLVAVASFADPPLQCFQGKTWRSTAETAVEWVMNHHTPRLTRDLPREIAFADEAFVAQEGVHSALSLPLLVGGEAIGSLTLDSRTPGAFTQDHVTMLSGFTEPLASAVRNAQLYAQVVRYGQDLESLVETRTRDLQVANDHLVEASRHKSMFLANMSHELRTPLNSILGFSDLLSEQIRGSLSPKQLRYLEHIHSGGTHLLSLINDLLDLSKVEAGKLALCPEPFALSEALTAALQEIGPTSGAKQLTLTLDVQTAPITLTADPVRFKQIIYNLLSNAVKFTPEGGRITVAVRLAAHQEAGGRRREAQNPSPQPPEDVVEIAVADTGIGIAAEDLPRLFTRFTQLEMETTKRFQGAGLGLALTKQLVELHGGTIAVASAGPNRGSTFTVRLPLVPSMRQES